MYQLVRKPTSGHAPKDAVHARGFTKGLQILAERLNDALIGKRVGALVTRVTCVPLDPAPSDFVPAGLHEGIHLLPQIGIFDGRLGGSAPAPSFPPVDPFGNALAHVLAVQVQIHLTGALERLQGLDHGHHFHAVIGRLSLTTKQFFFDTSRFEQHAPSAGSGVALTGAIGVNVNRVQWYFPYFGLSGGHFQLQKQEQPPGRVRL